MSAGGTPAAEIDIDEGVVGALLRDQAGELAGQTLSRFGEGFDNVLYRLGERWMVRLPRRAMSAALVEGEQRCLPAIARGLSTSVPAPVVTGVPGSGFPWHWSIVPWIEGDDADLAPLIPTSQADWLQFLSELHSLTVVEPPQNPYRGVPLADRATAIEERLVTLERVTDLVTPSLRACWAVALEADSQSGQRSWCWVHGDLHPRNVLTRDGDLSAVIDWGDLCAGDPATDIASIWMHFPEAAPALEAEIAASGRYDAHIIARARGWAISFGALLADTGRVDDERHYAVGARTLKAVATAAH